MSIKDIEIALKKRANALIDNSDYISESIISISDLVTECIKNSGKIFFCGNGGSAAESQHMAAEYCATLDHHKPREGMPALALTTDTSFITAWSNDFGYDGIFERQLMTLSKEGDLLFAYSTSGNSKNVCKAAKYAIENKIHVISMIGGHKKTNLEQFSSIAFKAPSVRTPNIQEIHTIVGHEVCQMVEKNLFNF
jgi:D-sedoheptulose 7-phosphate isomerase|tara:strand:+ start:9105 stop:9689 length:585 start_codon:yes stop_codon:yes gene_type:complete